MNKSRTKTPDPIVPDVTLEEKMKTLAENPTPAPTQALAVVGDSRLENIKKSNGGDRLAVRAANGRFTKVTTAVAAADAKAAQHFLSEKVKNEAGVELSRKQHLREALYIGAIKASQSDKGLGPAVKSFQALNEDAALTQAKESMLQDQDNVQNPVRIVVLNMPVIMHPEIIDGDKKPERPKTPSFAEVTGYTTNPPQEQK